MDFFCETPTATFTSENFERANSDGHHPVADQIFGGQVVRPVTATVSSASPSPPPWPTRHNPCAGHRPRASVSALVVVAATIRARPGLGQIGPHADSAPAANHSNPEGIRSSCISLHILCTPNRGFDHSGDPRRATLAAPSAICVIEPFSRAAPRHSTPARSIVARIGLPSPWLSFLRGYTSR